MDISSLFQHIVSITLFNKGKASQLFSRVINGETLLVVKNNVPVSVIMSPEDNELLRAFPKVCKKYLNSNQILNPDEVQHLINKLDTLDKDGDK